MTKMCRDCRFMRTGGINPIVGVCRRAPAQVTINGIAWPIVRLQDQTYTDGDGQLIRTEYAADSWCYDFRRLRFWHRWFDRKLGRR